MATRWSSEFTVTEHRDLQASAMAIDWTGVYVLLAGRRYLAVKNLNDPSDTLHKVLRQSKYEVGAAEWNPSAANKDLCAISSGQRVEIHSWRSNTALVQTHSLRSHTRVVSDLNWHRFDPNLLATCSIDTFIHVWDVRDQRRPALSLSAVAGATQVRWNRLSRYLLASAHDGEIRLWDQRKGTAPVQYIAAHLSKIYGLDWSPHHENQLATSSQDCTVKFFDITNPRRAESILTTTSPVWRARYTPFGEGLVTVVVPQLRRGENSLLLWNIANQTSPVHTFVGHTDVVLEFEWRKLSEESSEYQLITWSKDQSLRIWRIEPFLQKLCGHEPEAKHTADIQETDEIQNTNSRTSLAVDSTMSHPLQVLPQESSPSLTPTPSPALNGLLPPPEEAILAEPETSLEVREQEVNPSPTQPKTLQQEFSLINTNIPNVELEAVDLVRRSCTVTATRNSHIVILLVSFPPNYPYNAAPSFQFGQGTSVDCNAITKLLKALKQTAQQRVRKNKSCLEPCLRQLVSTLDQIALGEEDSKPFLRLNSQPSSFLETTNIYGSFQDAYIPFPRTSGAKFCSVGLLVCFGRPSLTRRTSTRLDSPTPRALSALGGNLNSFNLNGSPTNNSQYSLMYSSVGQSSSTDPSMTITSFYFQDRKPSRSRSRTVHGSSRTVQTSTANTPTKRNSKAIVTVYDVASLFFVQRDLGERYVFDGQDVPGMCHRNAVVAAGVGRRDLAQTWTLAALISTPGSHVQSEQEDDLPWPNHPFGKGLVESLIAHYAKQTDIQMAAMLCCAFGCRTENQESFKNKNLSKSVNVSPGGSPYHTIHQVDTSLEGWNYPMLKQNRSNSWSDSLDDFKFSSIVEHREIGENGEREKPVKMLDEKSNALYDTYKKAYAEILYRWKLHDARAQVLKYLTTPPETHRGVEFFTECQFCSKQVRGASCPFCKRLSLQCAICHVSVRGSSNFCLVCGHGGHSNHMRAWFETETVCPTGCGCSCLDETASILFP